VASAPKGAARRIFLRSGRTPMVRPDLIILLASPVVGWYMFLALCGRFSDSLFVAGLDHRTAQWVRFIEQSLEEIAISVFVEDQLVFPRRGFGLCVANLEESGSRTVRATDFHEGQVRVVQYVDDVLTSRKFGASHMELKWDVGLKAPNDLRLCFDGVHRQGDNQGDEQ